MDFALCSVHALRLAQHDGPLRSSVRFGGSDSISRSVGCASRKRGWGCVTDTYQVHRVLETIPKWRHVLSVSSSFATSPTAPGRTPYFQRVIPPSPALRSGLPTKRDLQNCSKYALSGSACGSGGTATRSWLSSACISGKSSSCSNTNASPSVPKRPVLPTRWMYVAKSRGGPSCTRAGRPLKTVSSGALPPQTCARSTGV